MPTAQEICDQLAGLYHSKQDGRSQAVAKTLIEIGTVLDAACAADGLALNADDLRSFWAFGLNAEPGERAMGAVLARKLTLAELLLMSGGLPRELSVHGARAVGQTLAEHFECSDDPRMRAMSTTFQAETDAIP